MDAILVGGGIGKRFSEGSDSVSFVPKQFQRLGNSPVFIHALRSLHRLDCFRQFIVVVPESYLGLAKEQLESFFPELDAVLIAGGSQRQDSSRLALEAVERMTPLPTRVAIHDACRPYLSQVFLERIRTALHDRSFGAWVPVVPVVDTLKRVENHQVTETVDRNLVQRVQTPQIFEYGMIRSLMERAKSEDGVSFTDDASLCEYYGIPVGVFEGDVRNIKLTYDHEISVLQNILERSETTCEPESDTTFTA